jgi:hypothetical protein
VSSRRSPRSQSVAMRARPAERCIEVSFHSGIAAVAGVTRAKRAPGYSRAVGTDSVAESIE